MQMNNDHTLADLLNLGPTSSQWLAEIGIHTRAELMEVGWWKRIAW